MCAKHNRLDDTVLLAPKTRVLTDKDSRSFTLKLLNWTNLRALGYDSLLILTYKLQYTSKTDALK